MNVGISYSFSESDTLEEQIADPAYYNFIKAVMNSNGLDPLTSQPTNLQDSWAQIIALSNQRKFNNYLSFRVGFTESMTEGPGLQSTKVQITKTTPK